MLIESILLIIMKFVLIASLSNKNLHNILKINEKYNYSTLSSIDLKYTEINNNLVNMIIKGVFTHKLPIPASGASTFVMDNFVIIFGGCMNNQCFNQIYLNDLKTNNWYEINTKGRKPKVSKESKIFFNNSTIYVIEVISHSKQSWNSIYSLNLNEVILI